MSKELDVQCAKALGYTVYHYDKDYEANCYYLLMDGSWNAVVSYPFRAGERKTEEEAWADTPRFSTDETAACLLEDEVEKLDKQAEYTFRLSRIVGVDRTSWDRLDTMQVIPWLLLRAAPEQRARAFLAVIKGGGL